MTFIEPRALALVFACAACGGGAPSAYVVHFAAGERAETAGRHDEAAGAFDEAARAAASPRERDHALFLAAMEYERSGDAAAAAKRFDQIAQRRGEHAAQARWQIIRLDMATSQPNVKDELDEFLRTYPNDGLAYPALQARLRIARDAGGEPEALAVLRALAPAIGKSDSAARVAFEIAESIAKLGKPDEARAAFVDVAARFPYPGEYFDDALWRASEIDEAQGRVPEAIADLQQMLAVLESSTLPGTYVRPRFPDAAWRVAELYRDKAKDPKNAMVWFERYHDWFPNALRRDEALWQEAKLLEAGGDESAACGRLAKIVSSLPDSRYVPCVVARCSGVERPKDSKAPKTCHAYITR